MADLLAEIERALDEHLRRITEKPSLLGLRVHSNSVVEEALAAVRAERRVMLRKIAQQGGD